MELITYEDAQFLFREILSGSPDRHNPVDMEGCLYNGDDGTHCIAGTAFVALGVDPEFLGEREQVSAAEVGQALGLFESDDPIPNTPAYLFAKIQNIADGLPTTLNDGPVVPGTPGYGPAPRKWGEVLEMATEHGLL